MKKKSKNLCVALLAAGIILSFNACSNANAQQGGVNVQSERWEYNVLDITPYEPEELKTEFNKLGRNGWEYVGSCGSNNYYNASKHIFKRRLR